MQNSNYTSEYAKAADMRRTPASIDGEIAELMTEQAILEAKLANVRKRRAQLNEVYVDRGRWERAYLVANVGGHVHSSTGCSTCFPTTEFGWLTEESGKSEAEIVEAAGELACTVCYPSAPVEVLAKPGTIRRPDQIEREARQAERAAKSAEKAAAAVVSPSTGRTLYKTERAAKNAVLQAAGDALFYEFNHPSQVEWQRTAVAAIDALVAKGAVEREAFVAEVAKKAATKRVREIKGWRDDLIVRQMIALGREVTPPAYEGKSVADLAPLVEAFLAA
ncbi:hypothetical protein FGG44_gp94 [Mycobacterium phage MacnCheese]|uniref:Uncharacterized protein n=1 Tax=Mycobacterium phage MacnCheese TaxID=2927982 RepID=I6X3F4_9CAUD|nr:hypothetical protein FGG44_gp94 [Mycobacterium phage MacnCheese]AFN37782.1 hypothetical protein MACNCHEESE_94 [Mycobacterium phage MacnCheese]